MAGWQKRFSLQYRKPNIQSRRIAFLVAQLLFYSARRTSTIQSQTENSTGSGKKAFGLNVLWNSSSFFLGYLLAIATSIVLNRGLGPSRAGIAQYITWLTDTGATMGGLGFIRGIERYVSHNIGANRHDLLGFIIHRSLIGIIILSCISGVVCCLAAHYTLSIQNAWHPIYLPIIFWLVVWAGLWTGAQAGSRGLYDFKTLATTIIGRGAITLVTWYFLITAGLPIWTLFLASLFFSIIAFLYVYTYSGMRKWVKSAYTRDVKHWREIQIYVLMVTPAVIADTVVWQRTELFFLGKFDVASSLAFYAVAAGLTTLIARVPQSLSMVLFPIFARRIGGGQDNSARDLYTYASKWVFSISLPLGAAALALAEPIVTLMYGPRYLSSVPVLQIMVFAAVLAPLCSPASSYIYSTDRQKFFLILAPITVANNLVLDWILISQFKLTGAAYANLLSQLTFVAAVLIFATFRLRLRLPYLDLGKVIFSAGIYYLICLWAKQYGFTGIVIGALGLLVYLALLFTLGVFHNELQWIKIREQRQ